ncbi:hypothetical protein A2422_01245 [Candidatus Woesebacteria bacterium RIFOXYC1_FULL_31_51]|uniref:Large ribosomal subunit protein bL35 n=1 Tax=Candidatus Woesebacteria bacterium GW2011_GWC2_31_9 TaxID=1618586 RepID=A0A0G0AY99_9BACT|nr:MAG: 50S ribosomal protein L35 [Candidatus Woesebacteria bacterium GW2011_GWF1_31_35]KKP22687.1 MAG: 50S ribosomal protein L35 [Candidatus Woesebacteria bacterium GW2011_GWC1_30_29]KKP25930.1 MAG: 50S ribosomal protein L35 [Candidatus Woesebacteria bacterium GW2011_GWD1_31_12]KKP27156.1 MAG: 50S ribosomal protein L35 [Candidatus Woesebacteria bacterium GW2011_GWB1_31_29]KKP31535.1 MAG: 50S ribosomal protein L35 [Candidatus Woesebacteria bacterium GW2011_GWC2_31_9]KKP33947.1 MAG: 50S ribosom
MGKQKTKRLLTNRIRITKNGKVLRRKAFKRHLNAGKSKSRLSRLKRMTPVKRVLARKLRKYLGKVNKKAYKAKVTK